MIASEFSKKATAEEVTDGIDMRGKYVLITGTNSGLGHESARVLSARGAHIIGTARDMKKARQAAKQIGGEFTPLACELSNMKSVSRCADKIAALNVPLDVVICNAGIMALPKLEQKNGLEMQFLTNHVGHFLLLYKLLDRVKQADAGRIVMLSSLAHKMAPFNGIDFDNLDGEKYYRDWTAYGQSKLANLLTALALSERLQGSNATANAVHPGLIDTNLGRNFSGIQRLMFNNPVFHLALKMGLGGKSVEQGASTQCYVATSPDLAGVSGKYFADNEEARTTRHGRDMNMANKLWDVSCELVKEYI